MDDGDDNRRKKQYRGLLADDFLQFFHRQAEFADRLEFRFIFIQVGVQPEIDEAGSWYEKDDPDEQPYEE